MKSTQMAVKLMHALQHSNNPHFQKMWLERMKERKSNHNSTQK